MNYLGLDPGTKCGWAILDDAGSRVTSGVWNLERRRGDGAGMLYVRFEQLFRELLATYELRAVAYEQQVNRYAGSAHVGAGIMSHLQRICEELEVPYTGVAFSVVKKHATGKGNCGKGDMIVAAHHRWDIPVTPRISDDEADALFIADAAREGLV